MNAPVYRASEGPPQWLIGLLVALATLCILALAWLSSTDPQPLTDDQVYRDMVEIHHQTGGQYGWPDFKNRQQEPNRWSAP